MLFLFSHILDITCLQMRRMTIAWVIDLLTSSMLTTFLPCKYCFKCMKVPSSVFTFMMGVSSCTCGLLHGTRFVSNICVGSRVKTQTFITRVSQTPLPTIKGFIIKTKSVTSHKGFIRDPTIKVPCHHP